MMRAIATDYEGSEPQTFIPQAWGHDCAVTAEFLSLAAAREACRSLREAGVSDAHVVILGQLGDEVSTKWGLSADERLMFGAFIRRVVVDAVVGAAIGGVLNPLVGMLYLDSGTELWAAAAAGLVFGALVGALVGGVGAVGRASSRREAHRRHPELDHALVGIETEDGIERDRAEDILRGLAPLRIIRRPEEASPA